MIRKRIQQYLRHKLTVKKDSLILILIGALLVVIAQGYNDFALFVFGLVLSIYGLIR